MGIVADIYGLSAAEAMALSPKEVDFLLAKAQVTTMKALATSAAVRELVKPQLDTTVREVREARGMSEPSSPTGPYSKPSQPVGPPT
jgi:hypothetical protein